MIWGAAAINAETAAAVTGPAPLARLSPFLSFSKAALLNAKAPAGGSDFIENAIEPALSSA